VNRSPCTFSVTVSVSSVVLQVVYAKPAALEPSVMIRECPGGADRGPMSR
jgi:hypothetical protein